MADNNTVILRVQLDETGTEKKLQQLVLDIEATRKAQAALTLARREDKVSEDEYAKSVVDLRTQLRGQTQEQTALTKNLELYRAAQNGEIDSYKATQAALSLALRQQQELAGSANNSTEASQTLTKQIAQYRETLSATDAQQGAFFRNIGNYPKGESLEPLIQRLIQLQEVEKQLPAGSAQAIAAQKEIGYQFGKVNEAAASAGLAQKDVTNKLNDYGERLRPAAAELAKLTIAQDEVAKSAGKESEAFAVIGFQIGKARKAVAEVPPELKKVNPAAEAATQALSDTATKGLGLLGEQGEKAGKLLTIFNKGTSLVSQGMSGLKGAGETGALGFKAVASGIALTGIGLFVIAISAVVAYFTQSAEGGKILAQVLGGLGAVVQVASDLVIDLGRNIVYTVTHPIEAIKTMGTTLYNALLHPIDTARGLGTAVLNLTTRVKDAASAGAALVAENKALVIARRELEIQDVKEQSRIAVLIRLSRDRTLSSQQQLANLREAGRLEEELTTKNIALQQRELDAINKAIKLKGEGKSADLKADKAAKEKEIAQTLAAQDELNAKIKARESIFIQQQTTAAAAAAKQRAKDAVLAKQTENELALLAVEKGSAAELVLKQTAIDLVADLELAGEKKTAEQVKLVRAKAEGDKLDLLVAFQQKEIELAKKRTAAQVSEVKREYAEAEQNLTDYLTNKRAAVDKDFLMGSISENTRQKQLNAIEKAGLDAALVNAEDYGQDKAKLVKAQADLEIKEAERVKNEKKRVKDIEQDIQDKAFEAAATTTDLVIDLFGKESAAGQAALITKKTLALAEIAINTEKLLIANAEAGAKISAEAPPFTVPLGIAYTVASDALAIASAAASAAKILGFRDGGIAVGPSHEQGGIPLYHRGRPAGIEIEGGEPVLTRQVTANPILLSMASAINQLAGGRALTASLPSYRFAALGAITRPVAQAQLRGDSDLANHFRSLGDKIEKLKIYTKTQETMQSMDKVLYAQNELGSS
jgi:hypothetical protein